MKATGIVRRVDDLGRVVIPKEVRRQLGIREADPIEFFIDGKMLVLKKYSPIVELRAITQQYVDTLSHEFDGIVAICDTEKIVAMAGRENKGLVDMYISEELVEKIRQNKSFIAAKEDPGFVRITKTDIGSLNSTSYEGVMPIVCDGDTIGALILLTTGDKKLGEEELKMMRLTAKLISAQMAQKA